MCCGRVRGISDVPMSQVKWGWFITKSSVYRMNAAWYLRFSGDSNVMGLSVSRCVSYLDSEYA